MNRTVRWKLWLMMFLEYSVWGAWFVFLGEHLSGIGVSGTHIGLIYSTLGWGALVSPSIAGLVVDRWFATERYLALSHFIGGGLLLLAAGLTNWVATGPQGPWLAIHLGGRFGLHDLVFGRWFAIYLVVLIYAIIYMPTLALTNSLSFHHMDDPDREFGTIRVGGTAGWIVANLLLTAWLWLRVKGQTGGYVNRLGWGFVPSTEDCFRIAGVLSLILAAFCLVLPHTPPQRAARRPAIAAAFGLLKNGPLALMVLLSFFLTWVLYFFFVHESPFMTTTLQRMGLTKEAAQTWTPAVLDISQFSELAVMALLPWFLPRFGVKTTFSLGILAWVASYAAWAFGPGWLAIASLVLHGFRYVFIFVVIYIYVDSKAAPDIRASAQGLITAVDLGIGNLIGSSLAGYVADLCTPGMGGWNRVSLGLKSWLAMIPSAPGQGTDWTRVFAVPLIGSAIMLVIFVTLWHDSPRAEAAVAREAGGEVPAHGTVPPPQPVAE